MTPSITIKKWLTAFIIIGIVIVVPINGCLSLINAKWALSVGASVLLRSLVIGWILAYVSGGWAKWLNEIRRREDPRFLALFRIAIALSALGLVSSAIIDGVVHVAWIDQAYGGYRNLEDLPWLIKLCGGAKPAVIWSVIALSLLFSFFLLVGFLGKISAFLTLQFTMALMEINTQTSSGAASLLLTNALWLLVLARSTTTWSIDCWLKHRRFSSDELVPAWVRHLAILQIMLCYFTTGIQKVSVHWVPGGEWSALYYIMQQPAWQRFDNSWMAWIFPLTQIATASIWLWEITIPLWAWSLWKSATTGRQRTRHLTDIMRAVYFFMGIAFHLGIFALMDIGIFPLVSIAYYPCLLLSRDFVLVSKWWSKLRNGALNVLS